MIDLAPIDPEGNPEECFHKTLRVDPIMYSLLYILLKQ